MAHPNPAMGGFPNSQNMYEYPPNPSQPFPHRPDAMYPPASNPQSLLSSVSSPPYYPYPYPPYDPQRPQHPQQPLSAMSVGPGPYIPPQQPGGAPGAPPAGAPGAAPGGGPAAAPGAGPYDPATPGGAIPPPPPVSIPSPGVPPNIPPASAPSPTPSYPSAYMPQQPQGPPVLINHNSILPPLQPGPMYSPYPPPGQQPAPRALQTAEVKLEISAKGLRDRDLTSKSDPTCVVFLEEKNTNPYGVISTPGDGDNSYTQQSSTMKWRELARTECIKNNLNPHFKVQISVPYHFEEVQNIRLGLWDIDSRKSELSHHDFLGDVRTTLGELVTKGVWTSKLSSPNIRDTKTVLGRMRDLGTVTVIVHENRDGGQLLIKAVMSGRNLDKKDLFTSDPYFILTQVGASSPQSRSQLYTSEVIPRNVNPDWKPYQVKATLPKGGGKQQMKFEFLVYDKDRHKKDDEIGKVICTVADLDSGTVLPVINDKKKRRWRKYKNSGTLKFSKFAALSMPSLVDYLQGGLKLHFSVAVDLTKSNGDPSEPLSLHYRQDVYGNQYIRALTAIANVLRVYTPSDNLFAAFGFGAELPGRPGFTSSCFPLGLGANPHCFGIEGILQAYNIALSNVKLSGPTNFAPIIEIVSRTARQRPNSQTNQNYDVLLILTDGVVSDYDQTVERIITASKTDPLSIIIVGIGARDFKRMHDLDSDDGLLKSRDGTRQADRDICQFVAFQDYEHAPPERLGAAVLAELPGNIVEYFIGGCEPPIMPGQRPVMQPLNG